jgi:signal transduction histidine kinase
MHLCATSTDILEMARGAARGGGRPDGPFSVRALLESVRGMTEPMCSGRPVTLRFIAPAADRRLGCEPVLSRVLMNLVTNALKATERGYVSVEARETPRDPSRLVWSVSDTGPGLTVDGQRALYRVFSDASRGGVVRFSSAGLGLAICRKLVASMGATLHVDTTPAAGTRFHFEIEAPRVDA